MMMIGLYHPGRSILHRAPTGLKVVLLALATIVVLLLRSPLEVTIALGATAGLFLIGSIPARLALAQLRPLLWLLLVIGLIQVVLAGWEHAVVIVGQLIVVVALAALVTLTTTTSSMIELCERVLSPVRHVGIDPGRVGLLLALAIRSIPLLARITGEVREAQRARGLEHAPTALVVPVLVRTLRASDELGEALAARGLDD